MFFADDLSLLESCKQELQQYLNQVRDATEPFGLKMNRQQKKERQRCDNLMIEQLVELIQVQSTIMNHPQRDRPGKCIFMKLQSDISRSTLPNSGWHSDEQLEKKLLAFENMSLRCIPNIRRT